MLSFYKGKKVFVTGHTGFKGTWMCRLLADMGADVTGYSLKPPTSPCLFEIGDIKKDINSIIGDIRDFDKLFLIFEKEKPEIVIHMAAQPIVTESYKNPVYTYETNVMGTVNICECIRKTDFVRSFINVTTDKVYENMEWEWGYREDDKLNGFDPYSNSKSCSELVTCSYRNSFFDMRENVAVSTMRAGNVIGGGDFAINRIVPDCIRAALKKESIRVRNPKAVRPFQHVLEPVCAYLMVAKCQYEDRLVQGSYNIGPDETDCITTGQLVDIFCQKWGEDMSWEDVSSENALHESGILKLDSSRIRKIFNWKPTWDIDKAMEETVAFTKAWKSGADVRSEMSREISEFLRGGIYEYMGK